MEISDIYTIGTDIDQALIESSALNTVEFNTFAEEIDDNSECLKKSVFVESSIKSPLGDEKELKLKKLIALAHIAAAKKGNPEDQKAISSPQTLSSNVDQSIDFFKLGWKVNNGEMTPEEAADYIVDKSSARLKAKVDYLFDSGKAGDIMTDGIILASAFIPYVGPGISVFLHANKDKVRNVVSYFEKPIKHGIKKGIDYVAKKAKPIVEKLARKGYDYLKEKGSKVKDALVSGLKFLLPGN